MEKSIAKLLTYNEEKNEVGFNQHEEDVYKNGYICEYFKNYLPAKLRLLQAIKKAEDNADENKKILLNAARIYAYTLFENTWYGYLIAYADSQESKFNFNGKDSVTFKNAYLNHLPSFSSAILHFGTCRDLFFPLLKILIYCHHDGNIKNLIENFKDRIFYRNLLSKREEYRIKYDIYEEKMNDFLKNTENTEGYLVLRNCLEECFHEEHFFKRFKERYNIDNNQKSVFLRELVEIRNLKKEIDSLSLIIEREEISFNDDLQKLLNNSIVQQEEREKYLNQGKCFFELNKFRNTFAHQLRMLWWKNKNCQGSWFIKREVYDSIKKGKGAIDSFDKMFAAYEIYQNNIYNENDYLNELISSAEILQEIHDTIAEFLNSTFAFIECQQFSIESQRPTSTV